MANFIRNTQVKAMTSIWTAKQKARELELRNLQQAFEGNGKPASFEQILPAMTPTLWVLWA